MNEGDRAELGRKIREQVLGSAHVQRALGGATDLDREFQDLITRYAWGEIWSRPGLDHRTRRVLVIGTLLALGRWEEFRLHARAALDHGGFQPEDLKEIVLQQGIYCGIPAANTGLEHLRAVLHDRDPARP